MTKAMPSAGAYLREWRVKRRMSQLDLALEAGVSTRHLSFVETGRASPSRDMICRLAEELMIPLRERNLVFAAAGYAPVFAERRLDDPELSGARRAIDLVLAAHKPWPALVVDRHWNLVAANEGVRLLLAEVDPALLAAPNALRIALHPAGLAPRIANFPEWRHHLLERLRHQADATADPELEGLLRELQAYPAPARTAPRPQSLGGVAVMLHLKAGDGLLSFLSATTVFGTAQDVTLAELTLETFLPADRRTADALSAGASDRPNAQ